MLRPVVLRAPTGQPFRSGRSTTCSSVSPRRHLRSLLSPSWKADSDYVTLHDSRSRAFGSWILAVGLLCLDGTGGVSPRHRGGFWLLSSIPSGHVEPFRPSHDGQLSRYYEASCAAPSCCLHLLPALPAHWYVFLGECLYGRGDAGLPSPGRVRVGKSEESQAEQSQRGFCSAKLGGSPFCG